MRLKRLFEVTTKRPRESHKAKNFQVEYVVLHFHQLFGVHCLAQIQRRIERTHQTVSGFVYNSDCLLEPEFTTTDANVISQCESSMFN